MERWVLVQRCGWDKCRAGWGGGCQSKWFVGYGYAVGNAFVEHFNNPGCVNSAFLHSQTVSYPSGWNQLTVVNGGGNVTFYLNGQNIGSDAYSSPFPDPNAALTFGFAEGGIGYSGLLQDVVLYNRTLSASEVGQLAGVSTVPEPSTLLLVGTGITAFLRFRKVR